MPKSKMKSIKRPSVYEALRKKGMSKSSAAKISNYGVTKSKRSKMARKAAATRRRSG